MVLFRAICFIHGSLGWIAPGIMTGLRSAHKNLTHLHQVSLLKQSSIAGRLRADLGQHIVLQRQLLIFALIPVYLAQHALPQK
jgi:hypothetical protein